MRRIALNRHEVRKPLVKHYLLIKSDGYAATGTRLTALESAMALLGGGFWPLWDHTRNRKSIAVGDAVAVYLSGSGGAQVIATARVAAIVSWSAAFARKYPLMLDGVPHCVLQLDDIVTLEKPISVKERLASLSFVNRESKKWGVAFMGGTRAVGPEDFRILTS